MDAVVMFNTLVLGALFNLSDDQIESQVRDRLSFMHFLDLGLLGHVHDAKTVWRSREGLAQAGVVDALFKPFDGHLARQGDIARVGQNLDASIVPVPRTHNTRDENKTIKNGKTYYGYKNHVNVYRKHKLVRRDHVSDTAGLAALKFRSLRF